MKRTSKACAVTEDGSDFISGVIRSGLDKFGCETQCKKYSWCRGIMVIGSHCRLLSKEQPDPIDGWSAKDWTGNWAEPAQWKNSNFPGVECYEKIITGGFCIQ